MNPRNPASLTAARRAADLTRLAAGEVVDLLVVGLGATGAGVALDAASRGLRVAAIDAHDLAYGTSRWSSKLVHGGLRYLASGQVGVAHECAVERGVLMRYTAPHLVRALPFVLPITAEVSRRHVTLLRSGYFAGELLRAGARTSRQLLPRPRRLSPVETLRFAPALRADGLRGGLLSWDGQLVDDARLVVTVARTAAAHGARIVTRCRAVQLTGAGAEVIDTVAGERVEIRARAVVNATGVWAGELVDGVRLRPSRGTHLVLRSESFGGGLGVGLQVLVEPGRFGLVLPQGDGRVIVGLTDVPVDGPVPDVPEPAEDEVRFLLDMLGSVLDQPVARQDVVGAFSGLRPLLDGAGGRTADLSRRHAVVTSRDGVVTVVGGKLTTYRRMAQDAVDAVADRLSVATGRPVPRCRTTRLSLVGAAPRAVLEQIRAPRRLVERYGTEAPAVLAVGEADPFLLEPVAPGVPVTGAELIWAVQHEGALDVSDLLDRRTRLGLVAADRQAALPVAEQALETAAHMPGR